jgi:flagellar biosynthesis component FlhA
VGGGRSINIHYARLLTEQEINLVRDRFHEDAEFLLEEALRKHVSISSK